MRERGGEAVHAGDGPKISPIDSTQPSQRPDARRRTDLLSDELLLTRRAGVHLLPNNNNNNNNNNRSLLSSKRIIHDVLQRKIDIELV